MTVDFRQVYLKSKITSDQQLLGHAWVSGP